MNLRDILEDLLENGPKWPEHGICMHVYLLAEGHEADYELRRLLQELYPGQAHPIEGSCEAYNANNDKWEGTARYALLEELLDELDRA